MNGFSSRIGLELANQRMDDIQRDVAKSRLAKSTSSSPRMSLTARRTLRSALARPLGMLSVGR